MQYNGQYSGQYTGQSRTQDTVQPNSFNRREGSYPSDEADRGSVYGRRLRLGTGIDPSLGLGLVARPDQFDNGGLGVAYPPSNAPGTSNLVRGPAARGDCRTNGTNDGLGIGSTSATSRGCE